MTTRRWLIVVGLAAYTLSVVVLAVRPYDSHHDLLIPSGVKPQSVVFECGAPWGRDTVRAPARIPYPVIGKPCDVHGKERVLAVVDVGLGLLGMALAVVWFRRDQSDDAVPPAVGVTTEST